MPTAWVACMLVFACQAPLHVCRHPYAACIWSSGGCAPAPGPANLAEPGQGKPRKTQSPSQLVKLSKPSAPPRPMLADQAEPRPSWASQARPDRETACTWETNGFVRARFAISGFKLRLAHFERLRPRQPTQPPSRPLHSVFPPCIS